MKLFVTGAKGLVGTALVKAGAFPLCSDITEPKELAREIKEKKPDVILHLAAKSDPEFCEKQENVKIVSDVNVRGTNNVMLHAWENGIPCVLMSSGQIWKGGFWERDHRENDKLTEPVNKYGASKLGAEWIAKTYANAKIIRASFVFSPSRLSSKFEKWERGETVFEPMFIRRTFIYVGDFVDLLLDYCNRIDSMPQVLHLAGNETCSWYDFLFEVAKEYGYLNLIKPRKWEVDGLAPRPHNAGLDTGLARRLGFRIPNFVDGIKRMKNEI